MKTILLVPLILMACSSCNWGIKYSDDIAFISSAKANSMEFNGIYLQGKKCLDLNGENTACAINLENNETLKLKIIGRPYQYRLDLRCSTSINTVHYQDHPYAMPFSKDNITAGEEVEIDITPDDYSGSTLFICYGENFPKDRDESISSKFFISVVVKESSYSKREIIFTKIKGDITGIILGEYARYSQICLESKCTTYKEKPVVEFKTKDIAGKKLTAWSESYMMRTNSYEL